MRNASRERMLQTPSAEEPTELSNSTVIRTSPTPSSFELCMQWSVKRPNFPQTAEPSFSVTAMERLLCDSDEHLALQHRLVKPGDGRTLYRVVVPPSDSFILVLVFRARPTHRSRGSSDPIRNSFQIERAPPVVAFPPKNLDATPRAKTTMTSICLRKRAP